MSVASAVGFLIALIPLLLTPGASFSLTTQHTLAGTPHAALRVIAGTATGIYIHALLAAVGLSALVMQSALAFRAVKVIGGCYLAGLGVWMLCRSLRHRDDRDNADGHAAAAQPGGLYVQAILANLLNPKAAAIYLTLAPQFLEPNGPTIGPMAIMATLQVAALAGWLSLWAGALRQGRRLVKSPRFSSWVTRIGGIVLIIFGLRTLIA